MKSIIGFTLIELLVVVAITAVLLAVLMPALDQAVYQAELAVCASRLKGIATAAQVYAADYKRHYPHRPGMQDTGISWRPNQLTNAGHTYDDRLALRGYLGLALLLDPIAPKGISLEDPHTLKASEVWGNYQMWSGFQYRQSNVRKKGMFRIGDSVEWDGEFYNLLASDEDMIDINSSSFYGWGTHPDKAGLWSEQVQDNVINNAPSSVPIQDPVGTGQQYVQSRWVGLPPRGPLDMNFAYDDGSVQRYNDVKKDDPERMDRIPEHSNGQLWPGRGDSLPAR